ncbi:MerR family transcriptional regulator/heat shock protein HspR [Nitrosomonas nitrosa]|uniref:HTH-type transcriptional regulator GlnR n=2 Tax=Nitrosomonas TaxID=914 RepID=A0A1I4S8B6_9PROT|nr:MerR family transcriptional regulator [Nitrosomonas nitrosa]MCW5597742.1 MerR family transcriptional regulator [Nitrosomonas sp.]PTQ98412.1 MerR family transcriptional regulator/heat shock protein HspR [Nitrosomonas nitrosa]CAE6491169.1 HTH-type transcriptional regulator GlnR [Nitrosomonas nitrosa]SFM60503.1 MerR family transcriptional regulator, heat shock protein HspR [Nitrosomonas nitrosa]HNP51145.1 MerR family transcriptional regulator [Nitrosomonas nitrosa]
MSLSKITAHMVKIDPDMPLYSIGVVEDILGIPQRILRTYEEKGVIRPSRSDTNRRLYSQTDLSKIQYVHYLTHIKKVNLSGVKEIFDLLGKIPAEAREIILAESEQEIQALSEEKKKILHEGAEDIEKEILTK